MVCLRHTGPLPEDLPVSAFGAVEQKGHLRWQCVIVPGRSPDVSMHATDTGRKMGGMGEKEQLCGVVVHNRNRKLYRSKAGANLSSDLRQ